jgi:hypothetical protein
MLSGIHPTDNQKRVIAITAASPSPKVASEEITGDANMVTARNILMKLGVISVSSKGVELTDKGHQIAQDENITDAGGQLTDVGNKLVFGQEGAQPPEEEGPPLAGQSMPNEAPPTGEQSAAAADNLLGLESFSLLRELIKG